MSSSGVLALVLLVLVATATAATESLAIVRLLLPWMVLLLVAHVRMLSGPLSMLVLWLEAAVVLLLLWDKATIMLSLLLVSLVIL